MRKLKVLGLALAAVFALSAISASAASAEGTYTSEVAHTTITGNQLSENIFTTSVGKVTCKSAVFDATATATSVTDLTVTPTYNECTLTNNSGVQVSATVNHNECTYTFTTPTTTGKPAPEDWHAEIHIECPAGKPGIVISGFGCTITVHPQTPTVPTVALTNSGTAGTGMDVLLTSKVTGITYETTGFGCGAHEANDAVYDGTATVKGADTNGNAVGITMSHP